MKQGRKSILLLLLLSVASLGQVRVQRASAPAPKLIRAGRVLDVKSGTYRLDLGILTEGERIKEIGPWPEVQAHAPKDAVMIDLSRATILPGLIDCHAHLLISADVPRLSPEENIALDITRSSASAMALMGARNAREDLEAGITSARVLGHSGIDGDAALRDAINAGWVPGPRIQASCRKITPIGGQSMRFQPAVADELVAQEFLAVSGLDEARRAVRQNLSAGADLIKIVVDGIEHPHTGKVQYMPVADARAIVEDAHRLGLKVAAHAQDNVAVQIAIDAGVDSIEHAWTATDQQLQQMKERGIFLDATDVLVPTSSKDRLVRAMKVDVKITAGSDMWISIPGKTRGEASLLELQVLHKEGMSNLDIIRSSTVNAAELMGWSDRVGELAAGKFADIIAVKGDPLQDLDSLLHVPFVMKGASVIKDDSTGHEH
jgi:imidazolonepropionase-like amidohydrolase